VNERTRGIALSIGLGAAAVYLTAHAVTGQQGLVAHWELAAQERALSAELETLRAERTALDARAARLRPESLDLDYLDEKARALLAAGADGELVFALDEGA